MRPGLALVLGVITAAFLNAQVPTGPGAPAASRELPRGFDGILLGMPLEAVKEGLLRSSFFSYRGDPDVSFLPKRKETVIDTEGYSYIRRALFQFNEDRLYTIILMLDPARVDFYSLYTHCLEKYGDPEDLSPQTVTWSTGSVRFTLEKPLTVKYVDLNTFTALRDEARVGESLRELARDQFLELF